MIENNSSSPSKRGFGAGSAPSSTPQSAAGSLSPNLEQNISRLKKLLPIGISFDLITRDIYLGETKGYFLGINGLCKTEVLQQIFSDLQNPWFTKDSKVEDILRYMNAKIGYAQVSLAGTWDDILKNVLSGPCALVIDGFSQAILIDVRS